MVGKCQIALSGSKSLLRDVNLLICYMFVTFSVLLLAALQLVILCHITDKNHIKQALLSGLSAALSSLYGLTVSVGSLPQEVMGLCVLGNAWAVYFSWTGYSYLFSVLIGGVVKESKYPCCCIDTILVSLIEGRTIHNYVVVFWLIK